MYQIPYRTNYWLWETASACIFVALGFVDPVAGATWKGGHSLRSCVDILVDGGYFRSSAEIVERIAFIALLPAVAASLLGWVLQAIIVVVWQSSRAAPSSSGGSSKAFGTSAIQKLGT
jgi:hypothetical protein